MPAPSKASQRFWGAAYGRMKAGHPRATDPKVSMATAREFAATNTKGLPDRVRRSYGSGPVAPDT